MEQNRPRSICCLVVLVGAPGSGKKWARANGGEAVHVSQDGLIGAITPHGFEHIYRQVYREAEDAVARAALQCGHTVIVDRTNRTREHRRRWLQIAREASCPAIAVVMTTPEALCRRRNAQRETGRLNQERMNRMFAAFATVESSEGFLAIHFSDANGGGITLDEILLASQAASGRDAAG